MSNVQQLEGQAVVLDRPSVGIFMALAAVPFVGAGLLLFFAWHTSRTFGAWPSYGNPDPKDANEVLYVASRLALLAAIPSVFALILGLPVVRRNSLSRIDLLIIGAGAVGFLVLGSVFAGLSDWYMD